MDLKGVWTLVFLLGLSFVDAGIVSNTLEDDEDFVAGTEGSGSGSETGGSGESSTNQTCSPCECQCQCDYPTDGIRDNTDELIQIRKQLVKMREDLSKQTSSLYTIEKHMKRVENDIESPRNPQCPEDFIFDRQTDMCYQLHVNKLTWAEAQRYCQHLGPRTYLAMVDTTEKLQQIREYLEETANLPPTENGGWDRQVWLGGMKPTSNDQWFWTATGQSFRQETKTLWGPSEPNNGQSEEDCLALAFGSPFTSWFLNDHPCSFQLLYMCERQLA